MKKITSLLLCMVLVLSMLCVSAAAADDTCMEAGITVQENGTVMVAVSARQAAANARLTVDFDSDCLSYVGYKTAFAAHSVKAEEEKLTIGLANSSANAVQAGAELVTLSFEMTGKWDKTDITVTAESYGGKKVGENLSLVVEKSAVIAEGWSGYTLWKLTDDGVLTVSPSGNTYKGKCNMKHYWKVNGILSLPWSDYAEQITKIVVEEGVDGIGQMAFYELPNLREVVLPESIVEIRNYAFKNCKSLTTADLSHIEMFRQGAFYGCSNLTDVTFASYFGMEAWAFAHTPYAYFHDLVTD